MSLASSSHKPQRLPSNGTNKYTARNTRKPMKVTLSPLQRNGNQEREKNKLEKQQQGLFRGDVAPFQEVQPPSQFMRAMMMDSKQRLEVTSATLVPEIISLVADGEALCTHDSKIDVDRPLFQPFPSTIYFQNYNGSETISLPLAFRNIDSVARSLHIVPLESPYFDVIPPRNMTRKVAPGVEVVYSIQFTPDTSKDYAEELVCVTERERFVVPIRAVGWRPIFDLPDVISFGNCVVKHSTLKTIAMRNIGLATGKVVMNTEGPFQIEPMSCTLNPQDVMQLTVSFFPETCEAHSGSLYLRLSTGETLATSLSGTAEETGVRLERTSIRFESTFITQHCQRTIRIFNPSHVVAHFSWKQFQAEIEESEFRNEVLTAISLQQKDEEDEFQRMIQEDESLLHGLSILTRKYRDNCRAIEVDAQEFENDDTFTIDPVCGEIWPNTDLEVIVLFHPEVSGTHARDVFLDITGKQERIPLKLRGTALGPLVEFDVDAIDLGHIFVGSKQEHVLTLSNVGDIDAPFTIEPQDVGGFSSFFSFTPEAGNIQSGDVTLSADVVGSIDSTFLCKAEGALDVVPIVFQGQVVGPSFECDVDEIDFGEIPFGFPSTKYLTISNTSPISMEYALRLPADSPAAREVEFDPAHGIIPPHGGHRIAIDIIPMWTENYDLHISLDIVNVARDIRVVPITATCVVPDIILETPHLDLGRCFLGHPYRQTVQFRNPSAMPAKYQLLPRHIEASYDHNDAQQISSANMQQTAGPSENTEDQSVDEKGTEPPILIAALPPAGVIAPNTITEVSLQITANVLNQLHARALFEILGSPGPPLQVEVDCYGQGAVVAANTSLLDWGTQTVLKDTPKTLTLSNESCISTGFECIIAGESGVFRCTPSKGHLQPGETINICVHLDLNDPSEFSDELLVRVPNSLDQSVKLHVHGRGTTIVFDQDVSAIDFGQQFAARECERLLVISNKGRVVQKVLFKLDAAGPGVDGHCTVMRGSSFRKKRTPVCPNPPDPTYSVFGIFPEAVTLSPGQSASVYLRGYVASMEDVSETLLCYSANEGTVRQRLCYRMKVHARFIRPLLIPSTNKVLFEWRSDQDEPRTLKRQVTLSNTSPLPVTSYVSIDSPFVLEDGPRYIDVHAGDTCTLMISFDPTYYRDKLSRNHLAHLNISYTEDAPVDAVYIEARVFYPNITFSHSDRIIDCGSVMHDTSSVTAVTLTNPGPMDISFEWLFVSSTESSQGKTQQHILQSTDGGLFDSKCAFNATSALALGSMEENGDAFFNHDETTGRVESSVHSDDTSDNSPSSLRGSASSINLNSLPNRNQHFAESERKHPHDGPAYGLTLDDAQNIHVSTETALDDAGSDMLNSDSSNAKHVTFSVNFVENDSTDSNNKLDQTDTQALLSCTPHDSRIFDIVPARGFLPSGASLTAYVTYYALAEGLCEARARCQVINGASYDFVLKGITTTEKYRLSQETIIFHNVAVMQLKKSFQTVTIYNEDSLPLPFVVISTPQLVRVEPASGTITAHGSASLQVQLLASTPDRFEEFVRVQVGTLTPCTVRIVGTTAVPLICARLQRDLSSLDQALIGACEAIAADPVPPYEICTDTDPFLHLDEHVRFDAELDRVMLKMALQSTRRGGGVVSKVQLHPYICDLGPIVRGYSKTNEITLVNPSPFSVSFDVSMRQLAKLSEHGISISPAKVVDLPPQQEIKLAISLSTASTFRSDYPEGHVDQDILVFVRHGPRMCIKVLANVCVPAFSPSATQLFFGDLTVGMCRQITIKLTNQQPVTCEWSAVRRDKPIPPQWSKTRQAQERHARMMSKAFEVEPTMGCLLPFESMRITVRFFPTDDTKYVTQLPFVIKDRKDPVCITLGGCGIDANLSFSTTSLEFGPIMPRSSGQEMSIRVTNSSDDDIEIYALEFDQEAREEANALHLMTGYDKKGRLLMPPRHAGAPLPDIIYQHARRQLALNLERKSSDDHFGADILDENTHPLKNGKETNLVVSKHQGNMPSHQLQQQLFSVELEDGKACLEGNQQCLIDPKDRDAHALPDLGPQIPSCLSEPSEGATLMKNLLTRYIGGERYDRVLRHDLGGMNVIVHGPRAAGKSTLCCKLSEHYEAICLDTDTIIKDAIEAQAASAQPLVKYIYDILQGEMAEIEKGKSSSRRCSAATSRQPRGRASPLPPTSINTTASAQQQPFSGNRLGASEEVSQQLEASTDASALVPNARSSTRLTSSKRISRDALVFASAQQKPLAANPIIAVIENPRPVPLELLLPIIQERVKVSDTMQGVIVDGLVSSFAHRFTVLVAWLNALSYRDHVYFAKLEVDESVCVERLVQKAQAKLIKAQQPSAPEDEIVAPAELDEEEYDALSTSEQNAYDKQVQAYRKKQRELKRAQQDEEARMREEIEKTTKRSRSRSRRRSIHPSAVAGAAGPNSRRMSVSASPASGVATNAEKGMQIQAQQPSQILSQNQQAQQPFGGVEFIHKSHSRSRAGKLSTVRDETDPFAVSPTPFREEVSASISEDDQIQRALEAWDMRTCTFIRDISTAGQEGISPTPVKRGRRVAGNASKSDLNAQPGSLNSSTSGTLGAISASSNTLPDLLPTRPQPSIGVEYSISNGDEQDGPQIITIVSIPGGQERNAVCENFIHHDAVPNKNDLAFIRLRSSKIEQDPHRPIDLSVVSRPDILAPVQQASCFEFVDHIARFQSLSQLADESSTSHEDEPKKRLRKKQTSSNVLGSVSPATTTPGAGNATSVNGSVSTLQRLPSGSRRPRSGRKRDVRKKDGAPETPGSHVLDGSSSRMVDEIGMDEAGSQADTLIRPRWVIPAHGCIPIHIRFRADAVGQYNQAINFQTVLGGKCFTVFAQGTAAFPDIDKRPRTVFGNLITRKAPAEGVREKTYIASDKIIDFGATLTLNSKKIPDNLDLLSECYRFPMTLYNPTATSITVRCAFHANPQQQPAPASSHPQQNQQQQQLQQSSASQQMQHSSRHPQANFVITPTVVSINPQTLATVNLYALPRAVQIYEDKLIICVDGNPLPTVYDVRITGAKPVLEIDRKHINFDRVLLELTDTKILQLYNPTMLPVAFHIYGFEGVPEVTADITSGVIEPLSKHDVSFFFSSSKPTALTKKVLHLDMMDVDGAHEKSTEHLQLAGEAYDVMFDMTFPRHGDTILDYEVLRVGDEKTASCSIKNRGKYEFDFRIELNRDAMNELPPTFQDDMVIVNPASGTLMPNDKSTVIRFTFRAKKELRLNRIPLLLCRITEPHMQQLIANVPVHVTVKSVYSRYALVPSGGVKFGAVPASSSSRSSREFYIKNTGECEFKFSLSKPTSDTFFSDGQGPGRHRGTTYGLGVNASTMRGGRASTASLRRSIEPTVAGGGGQNSGKFSLGVFTIYPCSGVVQPGTSVKITVDADISVPIKDNQQIVVDIEQRRKSDHPDGLIYELSIDACLPAVCKDPTVIFHGYTICQTFAQVINAELRTLETLGMEKDDQLKQPVITSREDTGHILEPHSFHLQGSNREADMHTLGQRNQYRPSRCFSVEENSFSFGAVLVNHKVSARINLSNISKVHAGIHITCRSTSGNTISGTSSKRFPGTGSASGIGMTLPGSVGMVSSSSGSSNNPGMGVTSSGSAGTSGNSNIDTSSFMESGFFIEPSTLSIDSKESHDVVINFMPTSIQTYSARIEISVDGGDPSSSGLSFEIVGEGLLPRIAVVEPSARTPDRMPLLQFTRTLVDDERIMSVIVRNEGPLPAKVSAILGASPQRPISSRGSHSRMLPSSGTRPVSSRGRRESVSRKDTSKRRISKSRTGASVGEDERSGNSGVANANASSGLGGKRRVSRSRADGQGRTSPLQMLPSLNERPNESVFLNQHDTNSANNSFTCLQGNSVETIPPFGKLKCDISFHPTSIDVFSSFLQLSLQDNEFESVYISLIGEGFLNNLTLTGDRLTERSIQPQSVTTKASTTRNTSSPAGQTKEIMKDTNAIVQGGESEQILDFNGVLLAAKQECTLALTNCCRDVLRFEWPEDKIPFSVQPRCGHLRPNQSCPVTVTVYAMDPIDASAGVLLKCKYAKIRLTKTVDDTCDISETSPSGSVTSTVRPAEQVEFTSTDDLESYSLCAAWNSEQCTLQYEVQEGDNGRLTRVAVRKPLLEPPYELLTSDGTLSSVNLRCRAIIDRAAITMSTSSIEFGTVFVFSSSSDIIVLKNDSGVPAPFRFELEDDRMVECSVALPFQVFPFSGVIPPHETQEVTINFSPQAADRFDAMLHCYVETSSGSEEKCQHAVELSAISEMPIAHVRLKDSDYLQSGRRPRNLPFPVSSPLAERSEKEANELSHSISPSCSSSKISDNLSGEDDELGLFSKNIRVIELTSCGLHIINSFTFEVYNPAEHPLPFVWHCLTPGSIRAPKFVECNSIRISTPQGTLQQQQVLTMAIQYTPTSLSLVETMWELNFPDTGFSLKFLIVGHAQEPRIFLSPNTIDFGAMLPDSKPRSREILLVNEEPRSFAFKFDSKELEVLQAGTKLNISPTSGKIPANGIVPLAVSFAPRLEQLYDCFVHCKIAKKPTDLHLQLRCEGYVPNSCIELLPAPPRTTSVITFHSTNSRMSSPLKTSLGKKLGKRCRRPPGALHNASSSFGPSKDLSKETGRQPRREGLSQAQNLKRKTTSKAPPASPQCLSRVARGASRAARVLSDEEESMRSVAPLTTGPSAATGRDNSDQPLRAQQERPASKTLGNSPVPSVVTRESASDCVGASSQTRQRSEVDVKDNVTMKAKKTGKTVSQQQQQQRQPKQFRVKQQPSLQPPLAGKPRRDTVNKRFAASETKLQHIRKGRSTVAGTDTNDHGDKSDVDDYDDDDDDMNLGKNVVDFGLVQLKEVAKRILSVVNNGTQPFQYSMSLNASQQAKEILQIVPSKSTVMPGSCLPVSVLFSPTTPCNLEGCMVLCSIKDGATYEMPLAGHATSPELHISCVSVKFGKTFIYQPGMSITEEIVTLTNRDENQIFLTTPFVSSDSIQVDFSNVVLEPGGSAQLPIRFMPRETKYYDVSIPLVINSVTETNISVTGTGVPVNLHLQKSSHKVLDFGPLHIGAVVRKTTRLINRSVLPLEVTLAADDQSLQQHSLTLSPVTNVVLKPNGGELVVDVEFAPKRRIAPFSEEISVQYLRQLEPLFLIQGECHGVVVDMDHNQLYFSAVVNSEATRRVVLSNTGDIGTRFEWQVSKLNDWFSISPREGYISPGSETVFIITFLPLSMTQTEIRCENIPCIVQGTDEPLMLDLVGVVQAQQAERESVTFQTDVRTKETRTIRITNDTNKTWILKPIIDNNYFSGPLIFDVAAGETKQYPISYLPLRMTGTKGQKHPTASHTGSIFFPLPDGKAILHRLIGQATPPKPQETVTREVPCKVWYSLLLKVENWLAKNQRFKVTINRIKAEPSTIVKVSDSMNSLLTMAVGDMCGANFGPMQGHDHVDVLPKGQRDFELKFFAYKEGTTQIEVIFKNETTGEYLYYEAHFKSTPGSSIETITLSTPVRKPVKHSISLHNPLATPITFSMSCMQEGTNRPCIDIHGPSHFRVPPRATNAQYTMDYMPLLNKDKVARLVLSCSELGPFQYDLHLKTQKAEPSPSERFSCALGESVVRKYYFTNCCPVRTDYQISIEGSNHFSAPPSVSASAASRNGSKVPVEVTFEPSKLGDSKAVMIISSPVGGEYRCPLIGQCLPPQPSGPHIVRATGASRITLPFKNVFHSSETFHYIVDHPAFSVKSHDLYKAGEVKDINIRFDSQKGSTMSKLTIVCGSGSNDGVEWIFYLKGVV